MEWGDRVCGTKICNTSDEVNDWKKTSRPKPRSSQSSNTRKPDRNYLQQASNALQQYTPQLQQSFTNFTQQPSQLQNQLNQYSQQITSDNRNYQTAFENSFPSFLQQHNNLNLGQSESNLWELDGELGGLFGPSEQEIYQYMYMSAVAGAAATYVLLVLLKKKRKKKV